MIENTPPQRGRKTGPVGKIKLRRRTGGAKGLGGWLPGKTGKPRRREKIRRIGPAQGGRDARNSGATGSQNEGPRTAYERQGRCLVGVPHVGGVGGRGKEERKNRAPQTRKPAFVGRKAKP